MQKFKFFLINFLFLFSFIVINPAKADSSLTDKNSDVSRQQMILHYVNIYRAKHWLGPLKLNTMASQLATEHSHAMANKSVPFGHADFNSRIKRLFQALNPCHGGAENVAFYKLDAKRLVDAWIASPGHRRNILGQYNVTGIGIAHGKPGWAYYTQIFVRTDNKTA